jgi:hypothetical protein
VMQGVTTGKRHFAARVGTSLVRRVLAIIGKRSFLNGRPTGIAVGWREMDQSRDSGDRRSRTGIRSPSEEVAAK